MVRNLIQHFVNACLEEQGFLPRKWLKVDFIGEAATNDGGPQREFFRCGSAGDGAPFTAEAKSMR